ncbi:hypothetical protein G4P69_10205 [Aetokthonos hydrillicola CCALA 1050]|nr:hypothetical protein [Aetokthonos hydrillicola CCALA 1050]
MILFVLIVLPGYAATFVSTYWGINDFIALVAANRQFDALVKQGAGQRELFIIAHRENTHRINVGFDGTWILLGSILAGVGVQKMMRNSK